MAVDITQITALDGTVCNIRDSELEMLNSFLEVYLGEGDGMTVEKIWELSTGSVINTAYTFSNSHTLSEYKLIEILVGTTGDNPTTVGLNHSLFTVDSLSDLSIINWQGYHMRAMYAQFSSTGFTQTFGSASGESSNMVPHIFAIYGIK